VGRLLKQLSLDKSAVKEVSQRPDSKVLGLERRLGQGHFPFAGVLEMGLAGDSQN
jgi:hypothetical protein